MSAIDTLIQYILTLPPEQTGEILDAPPKDGKCMTKEEYIAKIIVMMKECNDIPLLDIVSKLLARRF